MPKKMLFLDGLLIPAQKQLVDSLTPGILLGRGVFETMRSYDGKIFALDEHLERLLKGLKTLNIKTSLSKEKMKTHIDHALSSNRLKNARIRLTVWQKNGHLRISIIALPYRPYVPSKYKQGFKAVISNIGHDKKETSPHIKSINYLSMMVASRKAKKSGNDEALLLNPQGYVVEGSRSNIFFIKNKILYTPRLSCGCLCGITRQKVIPIAKNLGLTFKETLAKPQNLWDADEVFLTNSLIEIMPLTCLQGKIIGQGQMGPWTAKILKAYKKLVLQSMV